MPGSCHDPDRPVFRLAPASGWLNDPHGIIWHDGHHELFHQFIPDAPVWSPGCRWGRAAAPDLVRWRPGGIALAPRLDEDGCGSGSVAPDDGDPVIVYTSVRGPDLARGGSPCAVATTSGERRVVLDGAWVLAASTWHDDRRAYVMSGLGDQEHLG